MSENFQSKSNKITNFRKNQIISSFNESFSKSQMKRKILVIIFNKNEIKWKFSVKIKYIKNFDKNQIGYIKNFSKTQCKWQL